MDHSLPSNSISRSLLVALRAREAQGWAEFVPLFGPYIYGHCRRAGASETDAADLTQQVFVKVLNSVDDFRRSGPGDTFRGWLAQICRHTVIDHFRARQGRPEAAGGSEAWKNLQQIPDVDAPSYEYEADPEQGELARRAWCLIASEFSQAARQAFEMIVLQGQSATETAAALGQSPAAVRMQKSRILRRLREVLGEAE